MSLRERPDIGLVGLYVIAAMLIAFLVVMGQNINDRGLIDAGTALSIILIVSAVVILAVWQLKGPGPGPSVSMLLPDWARDMLYPDGRIAPLRVIILTGGGVLVGLLGLFWINMFGMKLVFEASSWLETMLGKPVTAADPQTGLYPVGLFIPYHSFLKVLAVAGIGGAVGLLALGVIAEEIHRRAVLTGVWYVVGSWFGTLIGFVAGCMVQMAEFGGLHNWSWGVAAGTVPAMVLWVAAGSGGWLALVWMLFGFLAAVLTHLCWNIFSLGLNWFRLDFVFGSLFWNIVTIVALIIAAATVLEFRRMRM